MSLYGDVMDVNVEQDFDDTSLDDVVASSKPNASVWRMIPQEDSTAAETAAAASVVAVTIVRASCVANNRVGEEVCDGKEIFFEGEGEGERSDGIFVVVTHVVSPHKVIFTLSLKRCTYSINTHISSIYFYIVLPAQDFWTGAERHCTASIHTSSITHS